MLTIASWMLNSFWACYSISFQCVYFDYLFLDLLSTTHHSDIVAHFELDTKLGAFILGKHESPHDFSEEALLISWFRKSL
jgi:hypothetical protein